MRTRTKVIAAGLLVVGGLAVTTGAVTAASDDAEAPITGPALDRASRAAVEHVGGGRVTETEVGDEDSYYEVEVRLDDGSQVDVQLDEDFKVVDSSKDEDSASDRD